ncbi:hypothetical protein [Saccharibacillus endophyticus]|uniref:Lipoprotein n=1 Tax=Saccharibacillus endophyticus TaxID=2060666 RepID=A0ABQ2A9K0_9BACL|nr:hypothetical protein [Saccharibacillus endophyticus]GGH86709.1 hypothetical protein GCM10007362_47130 [Saccharibacillus endophyticus]
MLTTKTRIAAIIGAAAILALTACSPTEWANQVVMDRMIQVKRYPDQQRPSVGYAAAFIGYKWKRGGETQPRAAWQNVPEVQTMYDPEEVDLGASNQGISVRVKTITGKSLEDIVKEAAAYEYKHQVDGIHIDAEMVDGDYVLASFPYIYRGEPYQGTVLAKRKGNSYVYDRLNFSPELTDEGKSLPFVPGTGSMSLPGQEESLSWVGGTINDKRIHRIVMNYELGKIEIPIEDDQTTYIRADRGDVMESELLYIEGQDENGKALYTWQY